MQLVPFVSFFIKTILPFPTPSNKCKRDLHEVYRHPALQGGS